MGGIDVRPVRSLGVFLFVYSSWSVSCNSETLCRCSARKNQHYTATYPWTKCPLIQEYNPRSRNLQHEMLTSLQNVTQEPFRASSPASVDMGMFARMSQATYLLGRVLRFHARKSELEDEGLRRSERLQLDTTLRALLNLVYVEGSIKRISVCAQSSICYR